MHARIVLAGGLFATLLAACADSSGPCGEYYDNSKRCWIEDTRKQIADGHGDPQELDELPTRARSIRACRAKMRKHEDLVMERVVCSREETCEEKQACEARADEARRVLEQIAEIEAQVTDARWSEAFESCRYMRDEPDPALLTVCDKVFAEGMPALVASGKGDDVRNACSYSEDLKKKAPAFAKSCTDVMSIEYEVKKKAAIAARDAAADDNYLLCSELRTTAEAVNDQAKKDAETLCTEMQIASSAKQAMTEALASIAAKRSEVSYYCTSALDSLAMLDPKSDWAKKTMDDLLKTCFIDAGKVIVEVELSSEYPYCSYSLTQVRDAITKYGLAGKDADFDAAIAKTNKLCGGY